LSIECPKCQSVVSDDAKICPVCKKVLKLECPNCHSFSDTAVCSNCGYDILVKCSKCSNLNLVTRDNCSKCGFSVKASLAYQECESDEYAAIVIKFNTLKQIKRHLRSKDLYSKFWYKIKNLLFAQIKNVDCKVIAYDSTFVINLSKELSLATSSDKAIRLAIKIVNAFVDLNVKIKEQMGYNIGLTLTLVKKVAEDINVLPDYKANVKLLAIKKKEVRYLDGLQIVLDQYLWDILNKNYKTDSLYSVEADNRTIMFYELILDSYVLPPNKKNEDDKQQYQQVKIAKNEPISNVKNNFNVFDINAKCSFKQVSSVNLFDELRTCDLTTKGKIISLKFNKDDGISTQDLVNYFRKYEREVIHITCTEKLNYKPWGVFLEIFKEKFALSFHNKFNNLSNVDANVVKNFKSLFELQFNRPIKSMTAEDARYAYMEAWGKFLSSLNNTVIIIDNFEKLDDTTIQTLELYFDKYKKVVPNFVFLTNNNSPVHTKISSLLRTDVYTEITVEESTIEDCLSTLKSDATDFINSFYFEKIKENFSGSYLYFQNALQYLKEVEVLLDFDNKLIIKNNKSVVLPSNLKSLYKARLKHLTDNNESSLLLAYSTILGEKFDIKTLLSLGFKEVEKNIKLLSESGIVHLTEKGFSINNYRIVYSVVKSVLKNDAEIFLAKNILSQLGKGIDDVVLAHIIEILGIFKDEYLTLWKISQFAVNTGDYDSYLKNCFKFLSLIETKDLGISKEEIEENKKDVYANILEYLYAYSPDKIYHIENILLMDAINTNDNEKIIKLSNLMLQGALLSSNYTDARGLLHNILSRMSSPTLIVDGKINTKFLLLSLVNIEILYNVGEYQECSEIGENVLKVFNPEVLEQVKPASFSMNLFVTHIMETMRLVALAKVYMLDESLEDFLAKIKDYLSTDLPDKDAILAIRDYIAGKVYHISNVEGYSPYSKIIYLILQEISSLKDDYKKFAQNIYQAKLLAIDVNQKELELLCDLMIGYAYFKTGFNEKAELIYDDVINISERSAMFNVICVAKYMKAMQKMTLQVAEEALLIVTESLAMIQKYNNLSKVLFVLFEKLYIELVEKYGITSANLEGDKQKLAQYESLIRF